MPNDNEYPNTEDMKDRIEKLKNNRSPGQHNIIIELFKIKQNVLDVTLFKVIRHVWDDEVFPEQCEEGLICPSYKKVDHSEPSNYRGKYRIENVLQYLI
jgi:hypothetical protein